MENVSSKDQETRIPKKEIQLLKQIQDENNHHQFKTILNNSNKNETNNPRNVQVTSAPESQAHRNTELIKILPFI